MCVSVEVARNKLQQLWKSSSLTFKFAATPIKPPKVVASTKARPSQAPDLTSTQEFDILLMSAAPEQGQCQGQGGGKGKGKGKGKADVGTDGDGSGASSSSSSGGGGGGALSQLRAGWIPFGAQPPKHPKPANVANIATVRKAGKQKLHKPEAETLDILSPAIELPLQLGRGDVQQKRKHKIERTLVPIIVGQDGVDAELAPKMRRSQNYAIPDKRSDILAECVQAYRAAAR